jgi:hypothetical protein
MARHVHSLSCLDHCPSPGKKKSKAERAMDSIRATEAETKRHRLAAAATGGPPACPECGQNAGVVGGRFLEHTAYRPVTPRETRSFLCSGGGRLIPRDQQHPESEPRSGELRSGPEGKS